MGWARIASQAIYELHYLFLYTTRCLRKGAHLGMSDSSLPAALCMLAPPRARWAYITSHQEYVPL